MIRKVAGNLLKAFNDGVDFIGHQVNCKGKSGAGVAKQIYNKWGDDYQEGYESNCKANKPEDILGTCQRVWVEDGCIANLYGQKGYGRNKTYTSYTALTKALQEFVEITPEYKTIALPYGMGAGLGGGDWDKIEAIIEDIFEDYYVYLYNLDQNPNQGVYTSSIRIDDKDILDITVKSGNELFSPSWDLVNKLKDGVITPKGYAKEYTIMMRESYANNREEWNKVLEQDRVVLQCYCKVNNFCHRFILADIFKILGADYKGELRKSVREIN